MSYFKQLTLSLFAFSSFTLNAASEKPAEYLVELGTEYSVQSFDASLQSQGYTLKERFTAFGKQYAVVRTPTKLTPSFHVNALNKISGVQQSEPLYQYELTMGSPKPTGPSDSDLQGLDPRPMVTNDSSFGKLWGVFNYGQSLQKKGVRGMDAAIAQAWAVGKNPKSVVVGVFDTGIDVNHSELQGQLWHSHYNAVSPGQSIDDTSSFGHGTHVSGTIAALRGNSNGIAGVAPNAKIAMIKIFSGDSSTDQAAVLRGLSWAYDRRAEIRVINHSWKGSSNSQIMREAFERLDNAGVVNIFAAGNDSYDMDKGMTYPAGFLLRNGLIVAAHDSQGKRSIFSNYSKNFVDLAAPGEDILSLNPKNKMRSIFGTSMAAPHVAGAVAFVWGLYPELSASQVRDRVALSGTPTPSLNGASRNDRRLNVLGAVLGETN